jgi:hypothetical protein
VEAEARAIAAAIGVSKRCVFDAIFAELINRRLAGSW